MPVPLYDNRPNAGPAAGIAVERVYCFDFLRFTDADWDVLDQAYRALPAFLGYDPVPHWFDLDEYAVPNLSASVEPPGLPVTCALPVAEWLAGDAQFRAGCAGPPTYDCE
jgi:hypothetical protein